MPELKITVDVNLHADGALAALIENIADCWSSDIIVRAGGAPTHRQENLVPSVVEAAEEFVAKPVSAAKAQEIDELNAADEKLSESELVDIRAKAQAFMKGNAENKAKVKEWLDGNGLARVTEMPKSVVPSFLALIGGGNS